MATESDRVNVGAIAAMVAVGAIVLVVIVGVLSALVRQEVQADVERKGGAVNVRPYQDLRAAQQAELAEEAKWTDKGKGILSIPIDRAMEVVVQDLRRDPSLATPTIVQGGTGGSGSTSAAPGDADGGLVATDASDASLPGVGGASSDGGDSRQALPTDSVHPSGTGGAAGIEHDAGP